MSLTEHSTVPSNNKHLIAKIHSIETCGTVDGPGIRYVIFFQGCPLRCQYCHNPDTWELSKGRDVRMCEIMKDLLKYKSFMKASGGGITASGGEPLVQSDFILELFKRCKEKGISTALDTSGYIFNENVKEILEFTDLVLLDIKSINPDTFLKVTSRKLDNTLLFATYLDEQGIAMWIRFVLVPYLTDNKEDIEKLAKFLSAFKNIQRVDVLPFHKMGEYKWQNLNLDYKLTDTPEPEADIVAQAKDIFRHYNFNAP